MSRLGGPLAEGGVGEQAVTGSAGHSVNGASVSDPTGADPVRPSASGRTVGEEQASRPGASTGSPGAESSGEHEAACPSPTGWSVADYLRRAAA
jgi:hypothetical protein